MAFKFVLLCALVAAASAGHLGLYNVHHLDSHHDDHHHAPAHYQFAYGVKDAHTGDIKEQAEHRDGHKVSGHYSLVEADGTRRVVHYQDNGHGFEAQVTREGHAIHHHDHHHGHRAVYAHAAPVHKIAVHAAPVHSVALHHGAVQHAVISHHGADLHHHGAAVHLAAPVHHGYASTYGHGHGHHASSYQSVNLHQDAHHDSHHYGHHY